MVARSVLAVVAAAVAVALSACGQRVEADTQRFDDHARVVAAAWSTPDQQERWASSVVPLGPLTVEPDWTGHEALMTGVRAGALDWVAQDVGDAAATGTVRYADGSIEQVTTLGARETLSEIFAGGTARCSSPCTSAVVTEADLTSVELLTARGPATVPAWAFHLDGLSTPVLRVAVAGLSSLEDLEPQVPGTERTQGLVAATGLLAQQGTTITVRLATPDCSTTSTAQVLETDTVVVVGATVPLHGGGRVACAATTADHDVTLTLAEPLGHRVLATTGGRLVPPMELLGH